MFIMFILTFIRIFLFLVTMFSTYLNISSEFFTGRIETINSVKNLSVEFPVIFKLTFKDLLNETKIKRTHKCVKLYYNGIIPTYEKNTHFRWTDRNCTKTAKGKIEFIFLCVFIFITFTFSRNFRKYLEFPTYF